MNFNDLKTLLLKDRSIRRFDRNIKPDLHKLQETVGLTRLCASGRNLQPLRYKIVTSDNECALIFPHLAWAGYYKDWAGPSPDERPTAYIIQCIDTSLCQSAECDCGINLQAITLGLASLNIGSCIIKSFNADNISQILNLPPNIKPLYVVALGYTDHPAKIVEMENGDYKYFRDNNDIQCVPKRDLSDLLI